MAWRPLGGGQLRFGNDMDRFARLVEGAGRAVAALPDGRLGIAPHSLRAVAPGHLTACIRDDLDLQAAG